MNLTISNHLSLLESTGLVQVAQVTPDLEYLFRHTLVQEAVYASLLDEDVQRLHLEVAEVLEELFADQLEENAATLARHFEKACQSSRAIHYYDIAGQQALEDFANQEAEEIYRRALALSQDDTEKANFNRQLGEALYRQSRYEEAITTWKEVIQHTRALHDCENTAYLYARCARAAWFMGDTPGGLELCLAGMKATTDAPEGPEIARLIHEAARAYYFNGMNQSALQLCRWALDMAERHGAVEVMADALTTLGILSDVPPEEALQALEKAVNISESAGLLHITSRALVNLGNITAKVLGDLEKSRQYLLKSAEISRQRGAATEEKIAMISWAGISLETGQFEEVEQALPALENLQDTQASSDSFSLDLRYLRLAIDGMRDGWVNKTGDILTLREEARQRGDLQNFTGLNETLLEVLLEASDLGKSVDWQLAEQALKDSLEMVERGLQDRTRTLGFWSMVRAKQGQLAEARLWLQKARQAIPAKPLYGQEIGLAYTEVTLAEVEKHWDEAIAVCEKMCAKHASKIGPRSRAMMFLLSARIHLKRGSSEDLEKAQSMIIEAQSIFERLNLPFYANLSKELMDSSRQQTMAQAQAQRAVKQELDQAGIIQGTFLPDIPSDLAGWQFAVSLHPARQTTGDFYDYIPLPDGKLGIVMADVVDKGMGAALYMTSTRTLLRTFAPQFAEAPEKAVAAANNRLMADTRRGLFVTLFYGVLDPANGKFAYCNAGHNPPYLVISTGSGNDLTLIPLTNTGVAVGIFADASYERGEVSLPPGAALALYTDGVTEAISATNENFGERRLEAALLGSIQGQPNEQQPNADKIRVDILDAVAKFRGAAAQSDDITLMVIVREAD